MRLTNQFFILPAKKSTIGFYIALFLLISSWLLSLTLYAFFVYDLFLIASKPGATSDLGGLGLVALFGIYSLAFIGFPLGTFPLWNFYLKKLYQRSDIAAAISVILGPVLWFIYLGTSLDMFLRSFSLIGKWGNIANYGLISSTILIGIIYFVEMILNNRLAQKKS